MNKRHILHAVLLLMAALASFSTVAAETGVLHLSPLHLELPSTWNFDASKRPIEGTGPDGEKVLISTMRRRPGAQGPATSAETAAKGFADGPMAQLAAKDGKAIVRPISQLPMPEGKAGYSVASEKIGVFGGKTYFIQYLLAGSDVLYYFTFEGKGDAAAALERFDRFFARQRWDE